MDKKNLPMIKMKPYRVSWKADGTRLRLTGIPDIQYITSTDISCTFGGREKFSCLTEIILCFPALVSASLLIVRGSV